MIPKDCKRLAEVDFPIAEVSKHAVREKSIRHGHPSTLHLWWARRPLASSRAMLLALLWPDPCDPLCPIKFKQDARARLPEILGTVGPDDIDLRHALMRFIADFSNWANASKGSFLDVSRALVKAAHASEGEAYEPPLVVDPFSGGGSIPLEALRVGCDAFASDLNPVACLILKVMLEDIPRHGPNLAEELQRAGAEIRRQAEADLALLYPKDPDGSTPVAYLWARTIRCESPNCGAEIPLVRSLWLSKNANRRRALRTRVERPNNRPPQVEFEIFEPLTEKDVSGGTVARAKATCLCCGVVLPPERVRAQLSEQRGGADVIFGPDEQRAGGAKLTSVVVLRPGESGRHYRPPTKRDYDAVFAAQRRVAGLLRDWDGAGRRTLCPVPNEPISAIRPSPNARGLSAVTRYGMRSFGDLYFTRQQATLASLLQAVERGASSDAVGVIMALALSRLTDIYNAMCRWESSKSQVRNLFTRQAIALVWDPAEANPLGAQAGDFSTTLATMVRVVGSLAMPRTGQVQLADAGEHPLPDEAVSVWFTDPPYYDAIPYADLSDFFLVWLKRASSTSQAMRDPYTPDNELAPKERECVWNRAHTHEGRPKDREFFEAKIGQAFQEGRRVLSADGVGCVVFAHQTTEGWEAFLSGLTGAGWTVTASWPIATELASRARARDNASLATSVHLVCRPRDADAGIGDWADVLRELPHRVASWMERLQREGVRGADLVFACIGPALEIFSRYSSVETAEGREVKLDEYLAKVWEVVGRSALTQVLGATEASSHDGGVSAVEEDARLTALFLWTLQATDVDGETEDVGAEDDSEEAEDEDDEESGARNKTKGFTLVHDVVRRFAQPLGIELTTWEGRTIETKKGVVRLLPVSERAKKLFGENGASAVATHLESASAGGANP
ncbi:MAG: DUF1156 domain-containing protein, partial [Candidatus Eisenbacteria bacterium]|nr:DUF1156 domain-containing protein [Candidatus Eisenbacteria bacterium]